MQWRDYEQLPVHERCESVFFPDEFFVFEHKFGCFHEVFQVRDVVVQFIEFRSHEYARYGGQLQRISTHFALGRLFARLFQRHQQVVQVDNSCVQRQRALVQFSTSDFENSFNETLPDLKLPGTYL